MAAHHLTLARMQYVRQLGPFSTPVAAVAVNQLTGDIVVCSADAIVLHTINGTVRASLRRGITSAVLCCAVSGASCCVV